ncbi:polysaccharide deacetylase family protein [Oceanobacillus sp. CFH 90083]|uniref:polysaccharide deacetylase family protein n=1 Tax=Oceanobacillus sp. CFH 90083 TaxID=2592336 RepID=UPI001D144D62|nr:polysaccharide deacetylase family protein [Oceanobacillus sp. CFH 90083]
MFRNGSLILMLIFVIAILSACHSGSENESNGEKTENQTEDTEVTEENNGRDAAAQSEEADENKEQDAAEENIEPAYYISEETSSLEPIDDAEEDVVLLTIDDAPDEYALEMAETLKEKDAKAIFFVNGHFIEDEKGQEKLKILHEMGFPIGNHTYSHPVIPDIPKDEQTEEIVRLNDKIEEIIGERPKFFRAPHGANSDHSREVVKEEGMVLMNWTYGYDYFEPYQDAEKLKEALITGEAPEIDINYSLLQPGANLLMHDREWTNEALGDVIDGLREQGYEIADPDLIETLE